MLKKDVRRWDGGLLKNVEKMDNGFLKAPALVTRTGVFVYNFPDGSSRRELRLPEEVFREDSLKTMHGNPVTYEHPPELINSKNYRKYAVGTVSEQVERFDEDSVAYVKTNVTVSDADAITKVEAGTHQVSCGYLCDLEEKSGVYNGDAYDHIQRNIRYNHLAITKKARGGSKLALRFDSDAANAEFFEVEPSSVPNNKPNGGNVMKITLDGVEFESENTSLCSAITKALAHRDSLIETTKKELDTLKVEAKKSTDELQAKFDSEVEKSKELKTRLDSINVVELVKARASLVEKAKGLVSKENAVKLDSMDEKEIKIEVIKAVSPNFDAADKSDDYINARFDAALETKVVSKETPNADNAVKGIYNRDGIEKSAAELRAEGMKAAQSAWNPNTNK